MKRCLPLLVCLLGLLPGSVSAVVLDWNSVTWTSGTMTLGYDIDPTNPGIDVTVTIIPSGGSFTWSTGNGSSGQPSPVDDNSLTGGNGSSAQSLLLGVNWTADTQTITVIINFNYAQGVTGVSYSLFDIDYNNGGSNTGYDDQVSKIVAQYNNGPLIAATTLTGSTDNTVSGSGTNKVVTGTGGATDSTGSANATIGYGTNIITSMTFTYGNNAANAPSNPGNQWIGLYDISYTPRARMPEVHPGVVAACFCIGLLGWQRVRRGNSGSSQKIGSDGPGLTF